MNRLEFPAGARCPARWDSLRGDGRRRFCRACRRHVHDLSAMTEDEARAFLRRNPSACVRFHYDGATGAILHGGTRCGPARARHLGLRVALAGALTAVAGAVLAAVDHLDPEIQVRLGLAPPPRPRPAPLEYLGDSELVEWYELPPLPPPPPPPPER